VDFRQAFIANTQPSVLVQPTQGTFHDPTMHAQPTAMSGQTLGQNRLDMPLLKCFSMALRIVRPISLDSVRTATRVADLAAHRDNGIHQRQQLRHIMPVGPGQDGRQGDAIGVREEVVFAPQLPSIRWIRPRFRPPKTARTDALSAIARLQSIWSAWRSLFKSRWWMFSHTPASCQSRKRRQQVIPEPQPISWGRYSHGMPVRRTKRIPVSALRSGMGGRPPFGRGGRFGRSGSINSQSLSVSSGLAIGPSSVTGPIRESRFYKQHRPSNSCYRRFC